MARAQTAVIIVLAVFFVAMLGGISNAVQQCSGGGLLITSDYTLTDDYDASGTGTKCFDLRNGADLNLNGRRIRCLDSCSVAIIASQATGSRVYSSVAGGRIEGHFGYGTSGPDIVQGILFDNIARAINTGSFPAVQITGNVIRTQTTAPGCLGAAISATVNTFSQIYNNYIELRCSNAGISVGGTDGNIHHNLIRGYTFTGGIATGSGPVFLKNIIVDPTGDSPIPVYPSAPPGFSTGGNICNNPTACPLPPVPWSIQ